ncbi:cation:proton antiporter regulatory subunit [Nocardioides pinisoli]|uniref:TrkA C-terminal domain-containing protein n=1 Tax=Nocardioides pinisoli TaxID=2950279 RepID=A0ABT1KWS3_9ACTN|nr:TrkA C-terminal domain-containing protein [Nocardioides pinisoli]MCP3422222.1 TrkA C-terminal domain-containing protein [Nocardioides pinisoli]
MRTPHLTRPATTAQPGTAVPSTRSALDPWAWFVGGAALFFGMMDYIEFDDDFSIARTLAPSFCWDKTLAESAPRSKHGVTIVGVKRTGEDFTYARPETLVNRHDHLIVSGPTNKVERFCDLR